jgi:hypothetical protein
MKFFIFIVCLFIFCSSEFLVCEKCLEHFCVKEQQTAASAMSNCKKICQFDNHYSSCANNLFLWKNIHKHPFESSLFQCASYCSGNKKENLFHVWNKCSEF